MIGVDSFTPPAKSQYASLVLLLPCSLFLLVVEYAFFLSIPKCGSVSDLEKIDRCSSLDGSVCDESQKAKKN